MHRVVALISLLVAPTLIGASSGPTWAVAAPRAIATYSAPVAAPIRVLRPFTAPRTRFGAGHRGVDLATHPGESVLAAGDGVVTFAGNVAGRGVVVIAHADGVRTEYEPVRPAVKVGAVLSRGQGVGTVQASRGHCRPGSCLHWGARRAGVYFDPLDLLAPLGVVRLLPLTG